MVTLNVENKNYPPAVSIIVPCRNERAYIVPFMESILKQEFPTDQMEIILADGVSHDGTREILESMAKRNSIIKVISNPERTTPCALNHAIQASNGNIIIRMDVHTEYAPDYIKQCVAVLEQTCADNVGGPWNASGKHYLQKAIALAFQSPFSSGGAGSHEIMYEGFVDSVYLGCWRKETLEKLGLFDEELVRNQDDELNLRIIRSGGKIWQSPKIRSWYYPRSSVKALFRQYMQYGYWKVRVIQKHKIPASIRHVIPGGYLLCLVILGILAFFFRGIYPWLVVVSGMYVLANILATLWTCSKPHLFKYIPIMPFVYGAYHFGYGYGFLRGVFDFILIKKNTGKQFTSLTR